jgi:hypothetical protein
MLQPRIGPADICNHLYMSSPYERDERETLILQAYFNRLRVCPITMVFSSGRARLNCY